MKKLLFILAALSLVWIYDASENVASAHGGSYRGPAGEVPPGQRDPTDPQPPPENPPPTTPGPEGPPTTPPPGGGTTPPPGGGDSPPSDKPPSGPPPSGPTGAPPGGTLTPGGGKKVGGPAGLNYESWLFWWAYNKDEFLNLKAAVKRNEKRISTETSIPFFSGGSDRNTDSMLPTDRMIKEKVVPSLLKILEDKAVHPDIRGGALIALARCGGGTEHVKLFFDVAAPEGDEDRIVRESAILALGILGVKNEEIRDFLIQFVEHPKADDRARCFAMISLGLLKDNSKEVYDCLERRLDGREAQLDTPVCALIAMGLIGDPAKLPDLISWLESGRYGRQSLSDLELAHIVGALGKTGHPDALKPVVGQLIKKGTFTKRSAAIALGQILPQADEKTQLEYVKDIARFLKSEKDTSTKNFALISLGRIGGAEDSSEAVQKACLQQLTRVYMEGKQTRTYAALALGILCFDEGSERKKPKEMKYEVAKLIRTELERLKGDKVDHGANAIALGLIGLSEKETIDLLVKYLSDRGLEKKLRGKAAVALGLIGDTAAKEAILKALREREDRDLRVDTAVAAGLLGSSDAVRELTDVLGDAKASQFVLGSVALALGQIGDSRAIDPLITILEPGKKDGRYPDLTRALVAVALGQIADRREFRVLYNVSKDINYRASVPALDELLTIM